MRKALKLLFMVLYFLILTVERVISLAACLTGDLSENDALDYYMIALTVLAIFGAYIFAVIKCTGIVRHSGDGDEAQKTRGSFFGNLAIAAGILLFGGMVHTDGSIPVMQFISYGMLLASMVIHTLENVKKSKNADKKWLSFAYITAFSMSIPVVYHTDLEIASLFIPIEIVVSAGMVVLFTIMLSRFYRGDGEDSFSLPPFLVAIIGDFLVLALRWREEVNMFVLIFVCITAVLWFAGNILSIKRK